MRKVLTALVLTPTVELIDKQKETYQKIKIVTLSALGFSDISSNPKHGQFHFLERKRTDIHMVKKALLKTLRENFGGIGLMAPASTYHRFAVGLTGWR